MKMSGEELLEPVVLSLYEKDAVKIGKFRLKSGIESPIYIDLRITVSHVDLLEQISKLLWNLAEKDGVEADFLCGVPYTALPFATCISLKTKISMLMRRKEAKNYGTKNMIEGCYKQGQKCLVVEDLVTSGTSTLETVKALRNVGLRVTDAIVLLDREQGGKDNLLKEGITLHSVLTMSKLLQVLELNKKISSETLGDIHYFLRTNQTVVPKVLKRKPYEERVTLCSNQVTKRLLEIMIVKKTNLAVAVDVSTSNKLLEITDAIGEEICILKTHVDILEDFSSDVTTKLVSLAEKHKFLILEDRKFSDIGNTVKLQYGSGMYHIAEWSDFVTAHPLPGPGLIDGLKQVGSNRNRSCLLVAQMSSEGNLINSDYTQAAVAMAEVNPDFVTGFISQSHLTDDDRFLHISPGVKLLAEGDGLGQQYNTPSVVIKDRGADVIIVGRGITEAINPVAAAKEYKKLGWDAYEGSL